MVLEQRYGDAAPAATAHVSHPQARAATVHTTLVGAPPCTLRARRATALLRARRA